MEFNKVGFDSFRRDIEEAVKSVAAKHQVEIVTGKINYSDFDFTMNLKVVKKEEGLDGKQKEFEKVCFLYGFEPEQYKVRFVLQKKEFELVGFNPNSPKNNCTIRLVASGELYKCNDEVIKRALKM